MGGILLLLASRLDYYRWRQLAWPLLLVTLVLLLIPLLPFTLAIAPPVNGARRWIDLGPINFQPSELARLVVVIWCAMLASKKGLQVREFKKGVLPFMLILGLVSRPDSARAQSLDGYAGGAAGRSGALHLGREDRPLRAPGRRWA